MDLKILDEEEEQAKREAAKKEAAKKEEGRTSEVTSKPAEEKEVPAKVGVIGVITFYGLILYETYALKEKSKKNACGA